MDFRWCRYACNICGLHNGTEVSGLAPNTIVIYERDNLIFGTGLLGDHNELRVKDMTKSLMDGNVRMKMVYNAGVQYYNPAEIVYFVGNVAP